MYAALPEGKRAELRDEAENRTTFGLLRCAWGESFDENPSVRVGRYWRHYDVEIGTRENDEVIMEAVELLEKEQG